MRCLKRAVSVLLPAFTASLVIPSDPLPAVREVRPNYLSSQVPVVDYGSLQGTVLKFSLPCDDCEEDERRKLEEEIFTVSLPTSEQSNCEEQLDTGIRVNGETLLAERVDLNGHRRWAHPSNLHFNTTVDETFDADWELTCGCLSDVPGLAQGTAPCPEYGYTLALQLRLGQNQRSRPGFTLTYDQHASSKLMRYSPFVEDISKAFDGVSMKSIYATKHWAQDLGMAPVVGEGLPSHEQKSSGTITSTAHVVHATARVEVDEDAKKSDIDSANFREAHMKLVKEVRSHRYTIQKAFGVGNNNRVPSQAQIQSASTALKKLESLPNLSSDVLSETNIHKVLKMLARKHDVQGSTEFNIRQRASDLLEKWEHAGTNAEATEQSSTSTTVAATETEHYDVSTQFQVLQHTQHMLGNVKHKFEDLESHIAGNAQSLLKHLKDHLPSCHMNEHPLHVGQAEQIKHALSASSTTQDKAMETRDSHLTDNTYSTILDVAAVQDPTTYQDHTVKALQITSAIFLLVTISGGVFAYLRRDPRRRAERAARREECRNRRLYRRAAQVQKWKNFVAWARGTPSEKRTYMMPHSPDQPSFSEKGFSPAIEPTFDHNGVGKELTGIRKAHKFVEGLLKANGRAFGESSKVTSRTSRHYRSYSNSGSEKSTPPAYGDHNEDIVVVDGLTFQSALPAETPDSSVIDTSSRHSSCGSSDYGNQ